MGFLSVKEKLQTILNELASSDSSQPFLKIVGNVDPDIDEFPYVMLETIGGGSERLDSASNLINKQIQIRAIWKNDTTEEVENAILDAMDKTMEKLLSIANLDTLDGTTDKFDIVSIDRFSATEDEQYMGFIVLCEATDRYVAQ